MPKPEMPWTLRPENQMPFLLRNGPFFALTLVLALMMYLALVATGPHSEVPAPNDRSGEFNIAWDEEFEDE